MKLLFLIPPSEGKNPWGECSQEELSFSFEKPTQIAIHVTEKDLKCTGKRYKEGIELNQNLISLSQREYPKGEGFLPAISRYSWVMYNAIDYEWMSKNWKQFFEENFLILSGMYWLLKPLDTIGNYKLPIETKWLYKFWWNQIRDILNNIEVDYIVNLLPWAYLKVIDLKDLKIPIVNINFLKEKNGKVIKVAHWVKKIKWEWIKNICETGEQDLHNFGWKLVESMWTIDVNIMQ